MVDLFGKQNVQKSAGPTQQFVEVKEIREGVIIIKNGGLRMLLEASSINFALKSSDEQTATILQFQDFLNSLDFSLQISALSRKLDIEPYLKLLDVIAKQQTNELLKTQTQEYIEFIRTMVQGQNIMNKRFFIVVPYERTVVGGKTVGSSASEDAFLREKNQLLQRVDHVALGLKRIGVKTRLLDSEEALNLLSQLYHPSLQIKEQTLPTSGLAGYA
ncbi:hypothetical protein C4553_03195 [Candidatus Parcubacteria bacterium]|nr:MAG: hypothetical protein C4553_03195 [Candidatus Parcubacteria bacterium]